LDFVEYLQWYSQQGEFEEELTTKRREDTESKDVFNSERAFGKHFVSGKPAPYWHKHDIDWVPTLQLAKNNYRAK